MPSRREYRIGWAIVLALLDSTCIFVAFLATVVLTKPEILGTFRYAAAHSEYLYTLLAIWYIQAIDQRLFVSRRGDALIPQLFSFTKAVLVSLVLTIFVLALVHRELLSQEFALVYMALVLAFMVIFRTTMRLGVWGLRRRGYGYRRILMIGANERAARVAEVILEQRHYGFQILGVMDDDPSRESHLSPHGIEYLGDVASLEGYLINNVVDVVYISLPVRSHYQAIQSIANMCESVGVPVRLVADLFPLRMASSTLTKLGDIPLLALSTDFDRQDHTFLQRMTDITVSLTLLILLSPLFLLIAVLIKARSDGPIFVWEKSLSVRRNEIINLLKFRTTQKAQATNEAPALTQIGALLHRYNLDELPQLVNILRGQISHAEPMRAITEASDALETAQADTENADMGRT